MVRTVKFTHKERQRRGREVVFQILYYGEHVKERFLQGALAALVSRIMILRPWMDAFQVAGRMLTLNRGLASLLLLLVAVIKLMEREDLESGILMSADVTPMPRFLLKAAIAFLVVTLSFDVPGGGTYQISSPGGPMSIGPPKEFLGLPQGSFAFVSASAVLSGQQRYKKIPRNGDLRGGKETTVRKSPAVAEVEEGMIVWEFPPLISSVPRPSLPDEATVPRHFLNLEALEAVLRGDGGEVKLRFGISEGSNWRNERAALNRSAGKVVDAGLAEEMTQGRNRGEIILKFVLRPEENLRQRVVTIAEAFGVVFFSHYQFKCRDVS